MLKQFPFSSYTHWKKTENNWKTCICHSFIHSFGHFFIHLFIRSFAVNHFFCTGSKWIHQSGTICRFTSSFKPWGNSESLCTSMYLGGGRKQDNQEETHLPCYCADPLFTFLCGTETVNNFSMNDQIYFQSQTCPPWLICFMDPIYDYAIVCLPNQIKYGLISS